MPSSKRQVGGDYYSRMRIQPWDAMEEWLTLDQMRGYLIGSAIAYLARFNVSDPGKGGIIDVCKAQHFLDRLLEVTSERSDDDDAKSSPVDFRGRKTDYMPGPAKLEPDDPAEFPPPGSEDLPGSEVGTIPDMTSDPDHDEVRMLNIKTLVDCYARRGLSSSDIAGKLNRSGFLRSDGKPWTVYQVAMLIASTPFPVQPREEN